MRWGITKKVPKYMVPTCAGPVFERPGFEKTYRFATIENKKTYLTLKLGGKRPGQMWPQGQHHGHIGCPI